MNKIVKLCVLPLIIILVVIIVYNFAQIKPLRNVTSGKFPSSGDAYKNLFFSDASLVPNLTFRSNPTIGLLQSYTFKSEYDVIVLPVKKIESSEKKLPISELVRLFANSNIKLNKNDENYDGSYKNKNIRFFSLIDTINTTGFFNIHYYGKFITKPIVKENLISYSLRTDEFSTSMGASNRCLHYIKDRNLFLNKKLTMEVTVFKKAETLYLMLSFPKNNEMITDHPKVINLVDL